MFTEFLEYLGIAFVSSAALIVLSKIILQYLIRRPADYYSAAENYQEEMMLNTAGFSIRDEIETNPEGELTDEMIKVEPQITVDQAVEMKLIDKDNMPDRAVRAAEEETEKAAKAKPELEDIKKSLEEAYKQQSEEAKVSDEPAAPEEHVEPAATDEPAAPAPEEKPKTRKRKPSMRMKKAELTEIALSMGIEIPEKATKQIILDLINEESAKEHTEDN